MEWVSVFSSGVSVFMFISGKKQKGQMLRQINLNTLSWAKQHSIKYHTDNRLKLITLYQYRCSPKSMLIVSYFSRLSMAGFGLSADCGPLPPRNLSRTVLVCLFFIFDLLQDAQEIPQPCYFPSLQYSLFRAFHCLLTKLIILSSRF